MYIHRYFDDFLPTGTLVPIFSQLLSRDTEIVIVFLHGTMDFHPSQFNFGPTDLYKKL